jgi:hypothetical protein
MAWGGSSVDGGGPDTQHFKGWQLDKTALDDRGRFWLWGGVELRIWGVAFGIVLSLTA